MNLAKKGDIVILISGDHRVMGIRAFDVEPDAFMTLEDPLFMSIKDYKAMYGVQCNFDFIDPMSKPKTGMFKYSVIYYPSEEQLKMYQEFWGDHDE